MQKCDPRAIARCPDSKTCGDHVFEDGSDCDKFNQKICKSGRYKPTNADRIRGMSDEELAVFMRNMMDCVSCHKVMSRSDITCTGNYKECVKRCKQWLRQPAEEAMHDQ